MKLGENIEYGVVAGLLGLCRILPESCVYVLFRGLGIAAYHVIASRRRLTIRNLEIAFPEKSLTERKRLARQNFINLAEAMALNTLIMSGRITDQQLMDMVETEGWENFEHVNRASSKGLLVFSAHLGNWELMPQYLALRSGKPLNVIARKTNNALLEERVVTPLREHFGVNVFYKKNAIMKMVKAINRGENTGILIDQRLNPPEGILIPFFGREAGATPTTALLQIRFNIQAIPIFMIKTGTCRYRFILGDPVLWTDDGRPMEEQVRALTQIHHKIIENMIVEYPDQWFWMHNRWGLRKDER
jgi:KDO2-lipid IV(A) lauroyltransferase